MEKERYNQILRFIDSKGRAYYDDIMQLYNLGIPVYRLVSQDSNINESELKAGNKIITSDMIISAIKNSHLSTIFY